MKLSAKFTAVTPALAITIAVLLFTFAASSPAQAQNTGEIKYPDSPRTVIIESKTVHGDNAPEALRLTAIPEFTLYGDGRLIYTREDEDHILHVYETMVDPETIQYFLVSARNDDFFDMNDNFLNLTVDNLDTTYITVKTAEQTKTISVYGFKLAAYQGLVPRGLENFYRKLTEFKAGEEEEKEYKPDRITLFAYEVKQMPPKDSKIEKWRVKGVPLAEMIEEKETLMKEYEQFTLEGDPMNRTINFLKNNTLFANPEGFSNIFYKDGKRLFKAAWRPHLPYE